MAPNPISPAGRVLGGLLKDAETLKDKKQAEAVKSVLTLFQPGKTATENAAKVTAAGRPSLNDCSTFLGIEGLYTKGNKAFSNKEQLAKRIVRELNILVGASECLECGENFTFRRGRRELLRCFLCHHPSHDCENIVGVIESRYEDEMLFLASDVWLCSACFKPKVMETVSSRASCHNTPAGIKAISRKSMGSPRTPMASQTEKKDTSDHAIQFPSPRDLDVAQQLMQAAAEIETAVEDEEKEGLEEGEIEQEETVSTDGKVQELAAALKKVEQEQKEEEKFPNTASTICLQLKAGACPHGVRGNRRADGKANCPNFHPAICKKFSRNGNGEGGCDQGERCNRLHKTRCPAALETSRCDDHTCRLLHHRGTIRAWSKKKQETSDVKEKVQEENKRAEKERVNKSAESYRRAAAKSEAGDRKQRWRTESEEAKQKVDKPSGIKQARGNRVSSAKGRQYQKGRQQTRQTTWQTQGRTGDRDRGRPKERWDRGRGRSNDRFVPHRRETSGRNDRSWRRDDPRDRGRTHWDEPKRRWEEDRDDWSRWTPPWYRQNEGQGESFLDRRSILERLMEMEQLMRRSLRLGDQGQEGKEWQLERGGWRRGNQWAGLY